MSFIGASSALSGVGRTNLAGGFNNYQASLTGGAGFNNGFNSFGGYSNSFNSYGLGLNGGFGGLGGFGYGSGLGGFGGGLGGLGGLGHYGSIGGFGAGIGSTGFALGMLFSGIGFLIGAIFDGIFGYGANARENSDSERCNNCGSFDNQNNSYNYEEAEENFDNGMMIQSHRVF